MYVRTKARRTERRHTTDDDSRARRNRDDAERVEEYNRLAEHLSRREGAVGKYVEPTPPVKDIACVVVEPDDLQATFENLVSVIGDARSDLVERSSVIEMLESIYEWMVFDSNHQITLPKELGSQSTSKMWPQGSKIDTRKPKDRSKVESSARRLRSMGADHASTVASSVVSSAMEEEGAKVRKGSVVYVGGRQPPPVTYGNFRMNSLTEEPERYDDYQYRGQGYQYPQQSQYPLQGQYAQQGQLDQQSQYGSAPLTLNAAQQGTRGTQRYSILGQPVEPPSRVEETPIQPPAVPAKKKVVKKVKVGSSSRVHAGAEGDVVFAD